MKEDRQSQSEKAHDDGAAALVVLAVVVTITLTPFMLAWIVVLGLILAVLARSVGGSWWVPLGVAGVGALVLVAWGEGAVEALTTTRRQFVHSVWQKDLGGVFQRHGERWLWVTFLWALPLAGIFGTVLSSRWGRDDSRKPARRESRSRLAGLRSERLQRRLAKGRRLPDDGVLLGIDDGRSVVRLADDELEAHALVVGATGSGKTTTLLAIARSAIRRRIPVMYVDLKGDPAVSRVLRTEARGTWCRHLEWSLDGPVRWNPLAHGNATELKDKLIGLESWTEPHYKRAAERYLQNVLTVLDSSANGRAPSLYSSTYGELAAQVGGLVLQDLKAAAGALLEAETGRQGYIFIDEFSALSGDHVLSLLARGRTAGLSVLLATQELADLSRVADGFLDQVLGNTAVKIAHRQDVPSSCEILAGIAGTRQVWEETFQTNRAGTWGFGSGETGLGSKRLVDEYVVHPNVLKWLQAGQAVLMRKQPQADARVVRVVVPPIPREGQIATE